MIGAFLRQIRSADLSGFGIIDPSLDPNRIPSNSEGWLSWAGVPVNERTALQLLTVWACVAITSDTISTLPFAAFRDVDGARKRMGSQPRLLTEPNGEMDLQEFLGRSLWSILMRGNAVGRVIERDQFAFPTQIMPLHPDQARVRRNRLSGLVEWDIAGESKPVPAFDMWHVKGMVPPGPNHLEGLSPIGYAAQGFGLGLAAQKFGNQFFSEGAHPTGILMSPEDMDDEVAKKYQRQFIRMHGGHRRPGVLSGGLKWEPISLNPEESQFLQTRDFTRSEICGFYSTPPHLVGAVDKQSSWGTGIEEVTLGWIQFGLSRWIIRFENALTRIMPKPQYVKANLAALLRGRLLDRYRGYLMGRQGGWLSIDDIRRMEDMESLPDGKGTDYAIPLNWGPIPVGGGYPDVTGEGAGSGNGPTPPPA